MTDIVETSTTTAETPVAAVKPFPWPLLLSFFTVAAFVGIQLWLWSRQETMSMLRIGWVAACSVLPALATMAFLGSLVQFRKRKVCSILSILFCIALFGASILIIQAFLRGAEALR